jgi:membrane protein
MVKDALYLVDQDILDNIIDYVTNTNVAALGALGFLVLLWTVIKTLLTMEKYFNQIWSVHHNRPLYKALAYYLSVILIVPLLVAASTTLVTMFQTADPEGGFLKDLHTLPGIAFLMGLCKKFVPFGITWVAFSLVYTFMVNTQVRFPAAIGGAFVTGLLWNLLQWMYIGTQIGLSKNAVYGTFAFLPVFLVFLYLSWLILLFGCRVAFALQNEGAFRRDRVAKTAGIRYRAAAGLMVLNEVAQAFHEGREAEQPQKIAENLNLPLPLTLEVLSQLQHAGIVYRVEKKEGEEGQGSRGLIPSRSLEKISIVEVIRALEGPDGMAYMPTKFITGSLKEIIEKAERARATALEGITVQDLMEEGHHGEE